MDRRQKLLDGIDIARVCGLEIGALANPLIRKSDAEIYYVDYAERKSLQKVYEGNPLVDPESIVEVDFIWGAQSLLEITGGRRFDYIVASHVIEHVPDLVTWLKELGSVLKPEGTIRLAVPDRRFTFDLLRRETELADVLNAYVLRARRPLPIAVLDYFMNSVAVDCGEAWNGKVDIAALRQKQQSQVAGAMRLAQDSLEHESYHDAHCWVFTSSSFANLFGQLVSHGLVDFSCDRFFDTERNQIEFFVALRPESDRNAALRSWTEIEARLGRNEVPDARSSRIGSGISLPAEPAAARGLGPRVRAFFGSTTAKLRE